MKQQMKSVISNRVRGAGMLKMNGLSNRLGKGAGRMKRLGLFIALLMMTMVGAEAQSVPTVQLGSAASSAYYSSNVGSVSKIVQDTCGNLYALESGSSLIEIPAGGGTPSVLKSGYSNGSYGLAIDSSNNLYVADTSGSAVYKIPSTNCVPQISSASNVGSTVANSASDSTGTVGWWWNPADVATDAAGNLFFSTKNACCSSYYWILEYTAAGGSAVVLKDATTEATSLAVDSSENIFFTSGGQVYELPYSSGAWATTATQLTTTLTAAFGLAFDKSGNLYIADSGTSATTGAVYEVPKSSTGLQFASIFPVVSGISINSPISIGVGANNQQVLYYSANTPGAYSDWGIYRTVSINNLSFAAVASGASSTSTLQTSFTGSASVASIKIVEAGATTPGFVVSGGTCAAGTAYNSGDSCTVQVTYTAGKPGVENATLVLADASDNALVTAQLNGTSQGAGVVVDPGTTASLSGTLESPVGVAVDGAGNVFVADTAANAVYEYAGGTGTQVVVGSDLSAPSGLATDAAGNLYIADAGNDRIVEVPLVNGVLSSASQSVVLSGKVAGSALKSVGGITFDAAGNLYIADTGNARVVMVPNNGGLDSSLAAAVGAGFSEPAAVASDASGNLYVADAGTGKVSKIAWPVASGATSLAVSSLSTPSALAIDASGSLYVVDKGNMRVLRIPAISGTLTQSSASSVADDVAYPAGLAMDASGNLYVSDTTSAAVYQINRTAGLLSYGYLSPGTSSGESEAVVSNGGNSTLSFSTPFRTLSGATGDYTIDSSLSASCVDAGTVAAGADCVIGASFSPAASDLGSLSEVVALNSNAVNATAATLTLNGTAAMLTATGTTVSQSSPAGTPYAGEAIQLTATVSSDSGTPNGGTVSFRVDGSSVGKATVSSGAATLALASGLTAGSHSVVAVYSGAPQDAIVYGGSTSSTLSLKVSSIPTTITFTTTTTYSNPSSDLTSNAITFTATVTPTEGSGIPTGTVSFMNGTTVIGSGTLAPTSAGTYVATYSSKLAAGSYNTTAVYAGDSSYQGVTSSASAFTVVSQAAFKLEQNGSSITSSASSPGSITLTLSSLGGWNGPVDLTCSGLPTYAKCVFSPPQPGVMASTSSSTYAPVTVTMQITIDNDTRTTTHAGLFWWLGGVTGLLIFCASRRFRKVRGSFLATGLALLLAAGSFCGLTACGSSNATSFVTPTGTSTVTVTAAGDQFVSGTTKNETQTCSTTSTYPCQSTSFQVALTVK